MTPFQFERETVPIVVLISMNIVQHLLSAYAWFMSLLPSTSLRQKLEYSKLISKERLVLNSDIIFCSSTYILKQAQLIPM